MMNNEKEKDAIDTSKLDEILPKYDPLKLNGINLAQNYVSAFNTGMNIYQCVNQLQGYIEWVVKAVNDVVKLWNVQVGESIDQSKAIVRETTTEQFNTEWTNKQPELIEQVNTLTTNQFNEDWGVLENRINTTLETQNTNIENIQNEQNELETNTNNNINAQNTKINSIQTQLTNLASEQTNLASEQTNLASQQTNLASEQTNLASQQTTLSNRMDTFTSLTGGSTTGDAELQDIRVGANGTTYDTAGNAVRGQYSQLKEDLAYSYENKEKMSLLNTRCIIKNGYYSWNGILNSMGLHKCIKFTVDSATTLTFTQNAIPQTANGYLLYENGVYEPIRKGTIGENKIDITHVKEIGFNLFRDNENYAKYCIIDYESVNKSVNKGKKSLSNDMYINIINKNDVVTTTGLYNNFGELDKTYNLHRCYKMDVSEYNTLEFYASETTGWTYGTIEMTDGTFNGLGKNKGFRQIDLTNAKNLYFNFFNDNETTQFLLKKETLIKDEKQIIKYNDCVSRPFDFQNKKALFFGDSITRGFTSGTTTTENGYPKLFSEKVGMTYTNYGVGGSCLAREYNQVPSIISKIKSIDINELTSADYIFISGGINDWQTGTTKEQLDSALSELHDYILANNLSNKIIMITPINEGGWPNATPVLTIQEIRNIITRFCMANNYSVVQGWKFPFPSRGDDISYINLMYGDKLHPTETGYKVYAKSLETVLC